MAESDKRSVWDRIWKAAPGEAPRWGNETSVTDPKRAGQPAEFDNSDAVIESPWDKVAKYSKKSK